MTDQGVGLRDAEAVASLRLMDDPGSAIAENPTHLAQGDVNRMTGDGRSAPGLANELIPVDEAAAMRGQRAQQLKCLRPHPYLEAIPEQAITGKVDREGSERDFRHGEIRGL